LAYPWPALHLHSAGTTEQLPQFFSGRSLILSAVVFLHSDLRAMSGRERRAIDLTPGQQLLEIIDSDLASQCPNFSSRQVVVKSSEVAFSWGGIGERKGRVS
jgi:hypothetical protein